MKLMIPVFIVIALFATTLPQEPRKDPTLEAEAMKLLDAYMKAWNQKDLTAWEATFHFPHYRLASGTMSVLDKSGLQDASRVWGSVGSDWHHSTWDRRKIIHLSPEKIHVDTRFTRHRADGSAIGSFDSLYVLTREGGRWGVKLRSSFAR